VGAASFAANGGAAFGDNTIATGSNSLALGLGASATQANASAIGNGATTTRANQVVIGTTTNTYTTPGITSNASIAAQSGPLSVVTTDANGNLAQQVISVLPTPCSELVGGALNCGTNSVASGTQSTALGQTATATGVGSTAVGFGASATAPNSVALGSGSVANAPNTVSVGSAGNERRITNVAAGINPTDAVNVSQLNSLSANLQGQINSVDNRLRDGVAMAAGGVPSVPQGRRFGVFGNVATYDGHGAFGAGLTGVLYETKAYQIQAHASVGVGFDTSVVGGRGGVAVFW
jgi:autotransporter adhesin